jgi:molybdopterin-guanine dinucleotide biosynthesis protein
VRQSSADLFPTDQPLPASQMIGRADDVKEIAATLQGGASLIVAGPRRTGKTSVCEAAVNRVRSRGLYTATIDLFRLADAAELAEAIATEVIQNRGATRQLVLKARRAGRAALSVAQGAVAMKLRTELGDAVEIALTPGFAAQDPDKALTAALELPQRIALADNKRCVVFFDEFQEIANDREPYGDPDRLTKKMRSIFQRADQVSFLFAGSIEHVMKDLFAPQKRAFSGFGGFFQLRPITEEDWRKGLAERFEADSCEITDEGLRRLIAHGELHPRVTMLVAQKTHLLSVLLDDRTIGSELVDQGYDMAYAGDVPLLDQSIEQIRSVHKRALVVARRVAAGQALTTGMHKSDADRALKKLLDTGLVDRVARGSYRIVNPLLRRHLLDQQLV